MILDKKTMFFPFLSVLVGAWIVVLPLQLSAQDAEVILDPDEEKPAVVPAERYRLVEPWTGYNLEPGEAKIGLMNIDVGLTKDLSVGTDFLADLIGAPNLKAKYVAYNDADNAIALGLRAAYISRKTILWGGVSDYFDRLDARIISPSLSWSFIMSKRLRLHTHWGVGIGGVNAELSEKGKRKLWNSKYPDGDYDTREKEKTSDDPVEKKNQEKDSDEDATSFKQRTFMFSSLAGLVSDIFQITGEFSRDTGSKVLATTRVEKTQIEDLKANSFRFTVAQQWIWASFQLRFGVGVQYLVISGVDLDGERVNEAGVAPAADIDFYWRF